MPKQNTSCEEQISKLREKLFDIEECVCKIKTVNDLFIPYANENSPQGSLVAGLIAKEVDTLYAIILR